MFSLRERDTSGAIRTLTYTAYNVVEELRLGQPLSDASQVIHGRGLISVLRDIQDELDAAVTDAYGWPNTLSTEEILFRLVELNAACAAEERSGLARWLRPEFQQTSSSQTGMGVDGQEDDQRPAQTARAPWPHTLPERVRAVRDHLMQITEPASPESIARSFVRARVPAVRAILETLAALGQATTADSIHYGL